MLAVLGVSDKRDIGTLAGGLLALGWDVVATEGTRASVAAAGHRVGSVADLAGVPSLFGGRVKTLTVSVMAGILARDTDADLAEMREHGITRVDLVACNYYRLPEPGTALDGFRERVDIGGPAMLRAAAKNYANVIPLTDPDDYPAVLAALQAGGGDPAAVPMATRLALATKTFAVSRDYDAAVHALFERAAPVG